MRKKSEMQKVNEEFVKTYDDSKYPKPSVTADIVIFGMFDKEEDNYRKIAEKELKVSREVRHHMKAVMPFRADSLVRRKPSAKPQNVN